MPDRNSNKNIPAAIRLRIVTPDADPITAEAISVRLSLAEGAVGNSGGAYGIRPGHTDAVLMLITVFTLCTLVVPWFERVPMLSGRWPKKT